MNTTETSTTDDSRRDRATGRTTRLIDSFVQDFFKKEYVLIFDHTPSSNAHKHIFDRFRYRLEREHGIKPASMRMENGMFIVAQDKFKMNRGVSDYLQKRKPA